MEGVEAVVARLPGTVIAVDDKLRVIALSPGAEKALGVSASEALGRACHDIMSVVELETGAPCHENCPLYEGSSRPGNVFNRIVGTTRFGNEETRLDCFLLKSQLSPGNSAQFCFLESYADSGFDSHVRRLQAMEAVNPAVASSAGIDEVVEISLGAVLRAASADAVELIVVETATGNPVYLRSMSSRGKMEKGAVGSANSQELLELAVRCGAPVISANGRSDNTPKSNPGWYVSVPLVAEGRTIGALAVRSARQDFDIPGVVRVLFSVAAQLGLHLWLTIHPKTDVPENSTVGAPLQRTTPGLRFNCLGAFEVFVDGKLISQSRFSRLKSLTLLKYLVAHRGTPVPREALIEVLWPGTDPVRTGGNLRVVLHSLRRSLQPSRSVNRREPSFVISRGDSVFLNPATSVWIDTEEFAARARQASRLVADGRHEEALQECQRATDLYRGEYMEDEPYLDWCLFERERLKELYLDLLRRMVSLLSERGNTDEAVDRCRDALRVDPAREDFHRLLMSLMMQRGKPEEALRQYRECRRILREEIGVEVSTETDSLYRLIIAKTSNETG